MTFDLVPLEVQRQQLALHRRVTCLGLNQVRWLHANVPGFTKNKAALGQWRTRVMLDCYQARLWDAQRKIRHAGMDGLAAAWRDFIRGDARPDSQRGELHE